MKSGVIRVLVVLAVFSILGIGVTQVYWFKRAFDINEQEFDRNVNIALYIVASKLFEFSDQEKLNAKPIERLSTNYYVVTINSEIDAGKLESLLLEEFQKRNILDDFEYGIYDCNNNRMMYCNYVSLVEDKQISTANATILPELNKQQFYFGVYFPNKEFQIVNSMGIWVFSSIVLFIVILFFTYSTLVILKQKRLSEIQKDFINNITHEFKTPISTIGVSTEVLKNPEIVKTPARIFSYATIIENETNRMRSFVDRVLLVAMVDDRNIALKKEKFQLHEVIEETVTMIKQRVESKNGDLQKKLSAHEDQIIGDKFHMINLVGNLLDNAIKYGNTTKPCITIETENTSKHILLHISDNGIGIDDVELKKVFNKFYRIPTGNVHNVKGFGLGLYYVKLIAQQHHGEIFAKKRTGGGTTFTLKLPLSAHG